MKYKKSLIIVLACLFVASCGTGDKKKVVFDSVSDDIEQEKQETNSVISDADISSDYTKTHSDVISVPFKNVGGIKTLDVTINGMKLDMIFDTGCSGALISISEARYLYEKGRITDDDFIGMTKSQIADGSIVEDMVINLKEVVIADKILCEDVEATVSLNSNAPLLLGGEILNRVAAYSVDNENNVINFKLK